MKDIPAGWKEIFGGLLHLIILGERVPIDYSGPAQNHVGFRRGHGGAYCPFLDRHA